MHFDELIDAYDRSRRQRNVFHDLMRYRVREVLLVASLYDSFVVESDGVLTEQIYGEYFQLNLSAVPRISCAYTETSALEMFSSGVYDLVVIIAGLDFDRPLTLASRLKTAFPSVPILLMVTNNSSYAALDQSRPELRFIDRVFVWNGYSKLFVGMIKYVEDLRNVDADTRTGLVRVILLIEDSVRYYSRYLPVLYKVVQRQTQELIEEEPGVETRKLQRSRARPKILLASTYEAAEELFRRYESHILTVITDLRFPREGAVDDEAGFRFLDMVKSRLPDLPVMIQSSEQDVAERAAAMGTDFADKNSESLEHELTTFMRERLGFGPFRFRNALGDVISVARTIDEFMEKLREAPAESVLYHAGRNDFSTWLNARGETEFARRLRPYQIGDFISSQELRGFIMRLLEEVRRERSRGGLPDFEEKILRDDNSISRLGDGSVGGKGRGIVFIRSLLDNFDFSKHLDGLDVKIPRTAFVGIDEFENFLESNGLWSFAFYEAEPEEVRSRFLAAYHDDELRDRLRRFVASTSRPLAVRSSGLFEDMLMLPFSGIYDTFIIPNAAPDLEVRLDQLCRAIRLIYASLFSAKSREYFEMAKYNLEEERMAVVIQELVGSRHGRWFYPHVSGTAQSFNYYPISYVKPEDGLCVAALGLGSYVVGGGTAYRFCPRYPKLDVVSPEHLRENSQRRFRALDMEAARLEANADDESTLVELDIEEAESDPRFSLLASTWDIENDRLTPGTGARGPRIIDLANILKHEALPFARAIETILEIGSEAMGTPVEIEYALNLDESSGVPALYILQLKPLIRLEDKIEIDLGGIEKSDCIIVSERSMGNGRDASLHDILWVDPALFDRSATLEIAAEIGAFDKELRERGLRYILIGPGRWGTRDHSLGVPVTFPMISQTRVIVEADLPDFSVESSLGSHFFHNVTSMNIGYFTVPAGGASFVDWAYLAAQHAERRSAHCVWTHLPAPMEVLMDGRRSQAIVKKPAL